MPHYLNYFDFKSLSALLTRFDFNVQSRFCSFPLESFLTMGDNYIEKPEKGRESHLRRVQFEWFMQYAGLGEMRRKLYRTFADLDIGREAILIAIKENIKK